MNTFARASLLLIAAALAGVVRAQAPAEAQKPSADTSKVDFSSVDKDANGRLSKQETVSLPELEGAFDTLDADHDGTISPTEFSLWERAGKATIAPRDPTTVPGGSAGAQHMPAPT